MAHPLREEAWPGLEAGLCWGPGFLESAEAAEEEDTEGRRRQAGRGRREQGSRVPGWPSGVPEPVPTHTPRWLANRPVNTGFALRALHSPLNLRNSSGVGDVPILQRRKERPREITARAGHSLDSEAEALNYHLSGDLELTRYGLHKLLKFN